MKRIQAKKLMKFVKILSSCFDDKRVVLDDEIHTLAYFHKDSVTICKEIKKGCDKNEEAKKGCDKKEEIKKDCDN